MTRTTVGCVEAATRSHAASPQDNANESKAAKANPGSLNCQEFFIKIPKNILFRGLYIFRSTAKGVIEMSVPFLCRLEMTKKREEVRRLAGKELRANHRGILDGL
jgi:hypothetical protein